MLGSLFSKNVPWNVNELKYHSLLNTLQGHLPGVNESYLYFGTWKVKKHF